MLKNKSRVNIIYIASLFIYNSKNNARARPDEFQSYCGACCLFICLPVRSIMDRYSLFFSFLAGCTILSTHWLSVYICTRIALRLRSLPADSLVTCWPQFPTIRSIRQGRSNHTRVLGWKWDDVSPYTHTHTNTHSIESFLFYRFSNELEDRRLYNTHTQKTREKVSRPAAALVRNGHRTIEMISGRSSNSSHSVFVFLLWLLNFCLLLLLVDFLCLFFFFGHLLL